VNALAAFEPQRESDRVGEVVRVGGRELVIHERRGYKSVRTFQERNGGPRRD
jgi:hypothetical protein